MALEERLPVPTCGSPPGNGIVDDSVDDIPAWVGDGRGRDALHAVGSADASLESDQPPVQTTHANNSA